MDLMDPFEYRLSTYRSLSFQFVDLAVQTSVMYKMLATGPNVLCDVEKFWKNLLIGVEKMKELWMQEIYGKHHLSLLTTNIKCLCAL